MDKKEETRLIAKLAAIHKRVNELADEEARSALVKGWASSGALLKQKENAIKETDAILDKLLGAKSDA